MAEEEYEAPQITVLGQVTDMTLKGGAYFDYGHATEGISGSPVYGPGGAGGS